MHGDCENNNGCDVEPSFGRAVQMIVTDRAEKFIPAGHRLFVGSSLAQRPEIRTPATRLRLDDSFVDGASVNEDDVSPPGISRFRLNKDGEGEELTVGGKSAAVVSYPLGALKRTYSTSFFIKDAFWHTFECGAPSGCPEMSKNCEPFEAICLIGDDEIDFHSTVNDEKLSMRLPFEITGAHRTKYGLLLQRKMYPEDHELAKRNADLPLPLLFTLSHPLNEILPIVLKPQDGEISARYACESAVSIVAVIDDQSLVLTYNSLTQLHSLWFAKKATYEEALSAAQRAEQSTCSLASIGTPGSAFRSMTQSMMLTSRCLGETPSGISSRLTTQPTQSQSQGTKSTSQATTSSLLPSTLSSTAASVGTSTPHGTPLAAGGLSSVRTRSMTAAMAYRHSPAGAPYASPAVSRLIAMQKASQSPRLDLLQESPPVFRHGRSIHSTPIGTPASSIHCVGDMSWSAWGPESLFPDMCLEWIWSENTRRTDTAVGERAAKAFVTEDFLGNRFACFLCSKAKQLRCVKVNPSAEGKIIAGGPVAAISCLDAAPVDGEQMMLIVDDAHSLQAYTGLAKMGGVYISSTGLFGAWPTPRRESADSSSSASGRRQQQPPMLSSSRAPSSIGASPFNEVSLSPVSQSSTPTDPPISGLIAEIERCVDRRLLVRLLTGVQCICRLAPLASNIFVLRCLHAVCTSLPKEKALKLCTQWYMCNNAQAINASVQSAVATELALLLHFLLDQMGLQLDSLHAFKKIERLRKLPNTSSARPKRSRRSDAGTSQDWEYLLSSDLLLTQTAEFDTMGLECSSSLSDNSSGKNGAALEQHAPLAHHCAVVFYALHLCYEEAKLDISHLSYLGDLAEFLHAIASSFGWDHFVDFFVRDYSSLLRRKFALIADATPILSHPRGFSPDRVPSVWSAMLRLIQGETPLSAVASPHRGKALISTVVAAIGIAVGRLRHISDVERLLGKNWAEKIGVDLDDAVALFAAADGTLAGFNRMHRYLALINFTDKDYERLPAGVALCLMDAVCARRTESNPLQPPSSDEIFHKAPPPTERSNLIRLRWPKDLRLEETRRMLDSSRPIFIPLQHQPNQNDAEFRDQQELYLYTACLRQTALPFGRAMLELNSECPLLIESVTIPELCTSGRAPPRNLKIELSHIDIPNRAFQWADFHNGVAAALKVSSGNETPLDSAWTLFNMPKATANESLSPSHAGFLFGMGLNGHLAQLNLFNIHEYLTKGDMLTCVAILLGIAAAKRGSADLQVYKMMATHLTFLLPPTLLELQIEATVQTAAVIGVGLVYAGSGHSGLAEALLKQMVKVPTGDGDPWPERESYALACGIAIGLVTLGEGDQINASFCPFSEDRPSLSDRLALLMTGGQKSGDLFGDESDASAAFPSEDGQPAAASHHVREGDHVNVHVTGLGATLAIGLMFIKTGNKAIAQLLDPPQTLTLLDQVRPDFLLLRTMCRALILWSDVRPSVDWVEAQIPEVVIRFARKLTAPQTAEDEEPRWWEEMVDEESVCQAYCYIVAGACFAIALRFAGSANQEAFNTLLKYCRMLLPEPRKDHTTVKLLDFAGKSTTNACLNTVVWSLGILMVGTGNLDVVRICRFLRQKRSGESVQRSVYIHSGHLAAHMTLGLLFLGGGRFSLSTSNLSIASLICAFFPVFPAHVADNRMYLQPLRHFWVMAVEPRLFAPIDAETKEMAVARLSVTLLKTDQYDAQTIELRTPCILPELSLIERIELTDERYWGVSFVLNDPTNTAHLSRLRTILEHQYGRTLVTRRTGFLPYSVDPMGHKSCASLAQLRRNEWQPISEPNGTEDSLLASLRQWCMRQECANAHSLLVNLFAAMLNGGLNDSTNIWQVKLMRAYINWASTAGHTPIVFNNEMVEQLEAAAERQFAKLKSTSLHAYAGLTDVTDVESLLAPFLVYFNFPGAVSLREMRLNEPSALSNIVRTRFLESETNVKTLIALEVLLNQRFVNI